MGKLLALTIGIFVVTAAIAGIYMFIVTGIFGVDTSIQLDTSEVINISLHPDSGIRHQQFSASASIFHMTDFHSTLRLHMGNKPVGAGFEDCRFYFFVFHKA